MQEKFFNLTNPQKSIWYTEGFYKGTPIENITGIVLINDKVNFKLLEKAINIFVQKNDSFRLKFTIKDNQVVQYLDKYVKFPIEILQISSEEDLKVKEKEIAESVFDTIDSLLFNFKIVKFKNNYGGFIINMHHLICDAWSTGLGATGIIEIYTRLLKNENVEDIVYPSYIEYINSEQEYLRSDKFEKDKKFWSNLFETIPEIATIPSIIKQNNKSLDSASKRKQFILSKEFINKINEFCKANKVSIFNFFMGIFSVYIGRVSNLEEFTIGSPILNRKNVKEKHTSGIFISTIPLKINLSDKISFIDFVSNIGTDLFNVFKHQKYPYLSLLEDLRSKDSSIPSLYNILISYQNTRSSAQTSETPYNIEWIPNNNISDDLDIHIFDMNDTGNINIAYDYKLSKYNEENIIDIHNRILNLINQVLNNNNILVDNLEIVTPDEKQKLIYDFNNTKYDYPKDKTIAELFEEQVKRTPDNIALVFEDKELTYTELNEKANSLATFLRSKNIGRNDIVGIMVNRSLEMIISILAVLKAGGTYIPIDPEYPQDRVEYMLNNSNAKLLLTFESLKDKVIFDNKIFVELSSNIYTKNKSNLDNINNYDDLTYMIYTSGSTGLPKGVMLKNINIVNFIYSMQQAFNLTEKNSIVSITTISFDIFVLESLLPLLTGMKIVIASEKAQRDTKLLTELCAKHNIDIIQSTPSRIQAFLFDENFVAQINNIKYLLIGGEPFPHKLLKELHSVYKGKIFNMYGPTETAVWSSIKDLSDTNHITIGKPIGNTQMYVLDKKHNLLPAETPGELFISGDGVCKGYYKKPDLTNKAFTPNPFIKNSVIYKTGDYCRLLPNGEFEYLERIDNQVKIRGLRIELGEIESCICTYPDIEKCVVVVNDAQKIIAYFKSSKKINENDLKAFLQRKLPSYFIPNAFLQVEKFKMTPNGKVDRKALAKVKVDVVTEYEAPKTEYQKQLVKIFESVLGNKKIGINDNFFEIGGDSLSAIKLQIEAFNQGLDLSYKDIFTYPTIKLLAQNAIKSTDNIKTEIYDYTKIDKLLANNTNAGKPRMKKDNIKNILLTGSTGFLGSHILDYLIRHTRSNIYCLIRAKNNTDPQTRLLDTLHFYFGNKYDKLIFKRIFAIEGNISKNKLGLNSLYYNELGNSINCVINSAAIVKHYGNSKLFNDTNITGTQNIIDFCNKFNCKLIHISTLSVSGNIFNDETYNPNDLITFSEKNLFINQDLSNIYINTKFIAERLILENIIDKNLNAKIMRVGNITNRFSDGDFQINISENAFLNRIHSFVQIGCVPVSLKNMPIEFTPVDVCASAIVNISKYDNPFTIFHVFNNNYITFEKLVKILNSLNVPLEFVDDTIFNNKIKELSKNEDSKNMLSGIINDFSKNKKLEFVTNIKMENNFTNKYLKRILFQWPKVNEKYIRKYVAYLKSIGYIEH